MTRQEPELLFLVLSAASVDLTSFLLAHFLEIPLSYAYFVGVNLTIFLAYGFDKYQAIRSHPRVPEIVLHLLALAGGHSGGLADSNYLQTHNPKTLLQNHLHSDCMDPAYNHYKHGIVAPGPRF